MTMLTTACNGADDVFKYMLNTKIHAMKMTQNLKNIQNCNIVSNFHSHEIRLTMHTSLKTRTQLLDRFHLLYRHHSSIAQSVRYTHTYFTSTCFSKLSIGNCYFHWMTFDLTENEVDSIQMEVELNCLRVLSSISTSYWCQFQYSKP